MSNNPFNLAKQYFDYMNFRANEENTQHKLSLEFYQMALEQGCPFFFGIYHDSEKITKDIQNEKAFEKWQNKLAKKSNS